LRAAFLEKAGATLEVTDRPDPELRVGGAIVRMTAAPILSFMKKVVSGELGYPMATPWIPGANGVGIVESIAEDVIGLTPGDRVLVDPHAYTHTTTDAYDGILIGLTALSPNSAPLQQRWRNGTFAEKALIPAECLTVIPKQLEHDPSAISILSFAAIAYGGLLKGRFRPGQTLVVSGATGSIGSLAVLVGLAMGAGRVIALGREQAVLEKLKEFEPNRVVGVKLAGDLERDTNAVKAAAGGADLVYDMLGNVPDFEPTSAAIHSLRRGGTAVLMGGVQAPIDLPYSYVMQNEITIHGAFMFPRSAPRELLAMVEAGTLNLSKATIRNFTLDEIDAALGHAERSRGPSWSVLTPQAS
jgi:alcohol dehydrogenase